MNTNRLRGIAVFGLFLASAPAFSFPSELPPETDGIALANAIQRFADFVDSPNGRALYAADFDVARLAAHARAVRLLPSAADLVDRFGERHCFRNGAVADAIEYRASEECAQWIRKNSAELYATLAHELMNGIGVELPVDGVGSRYDYSKKMLAIEPSLLYRGQNFLLHPTCRIWMMSLGSFSGLPMELSVGNAAIVRSKGYDYQGSWQRNSPDDSRKPILFLEPNSDDPVRELSRHRWIIRYNFRISAYRENDYPSMLAIKWHEVAAKIRHYGDQYSVEKIKDGAKLTQTFVSGLPECVKIPSRGAL